MSSAACISSWSDGASQGVTGVLRRSSNRTSRRSDRLRELRRPRRACGVGTATPWPSCPKDTSTAPRDFFRRSVGVRAGQRPRPGP